MKANLRAGKKGAKGAVKKYADGGMAGGKIAPPGIAAMSAPSSAPDVRGAGLAGLTGAAPMNQNVSPGMPTRMPPPMVAPRGFGPNDGGPSPGMGPKGYGMGRPGMGRHDMDHHGMGRPGMGRPGTGGPMPQQMPVGGGMRPYGVPAASPANIRPMTAGASVMPEGRAFKKGGMVGCDWSPKSSTTMRGAARKGK